MLAIIIILLIVIVLKDIYIPKPKSKRLRQIERNLKYLEGDHIKPGMTIDDIQKDAVKRYPLPDDQN